MQLPKITKYLNFQDISKLYPTRTTQTIGVGNNSGEKLGLIEWRSGWRRYVFVTLASEALTLDSDCLKDITAVIDELMKERKKV